MKMVILGTVQRQHDEGDWISERCLTRILLESEYDRNLATPGIIPLMMRTVVMTNNESMELQSFLIGSVRHDVV